MRFVAKRAGSRALSNPPLALRTSSDTFHLPLFRSPGAALSDDDQLPPLVRDLIRERIRSIEALEVVVLLRERA